MKKKIAVILAAGKRYQNEIFSEQGFASRSRSDRW